MARRDLLEIPVSDLMPGMVVVESVFGSPTHRTVLGKPFHTSSAHRFQPVAFHVGGGRIWTWHKGGTVMIEP